MIYLFLKSRYFNSSHNLIFANGGLQPAEGQNADITELKQRINTTKEGIGSDILGDVAFSAESAMNLRKEEIKNLALQALTKINGANDEDKTTRKQIENARDEALQAIDENEEKYKLLADYVDKKTQLAATLLTNEQGFESMKANGFSLEEIKILTEISAELTDAASVFDKMELPEVATDKKEISEAAKKQAAEFDNSVAGYLAGMQNDTSINAVEAFFDKSGLQKMMAGEQARPEEVSAAFVDGVKNLFSQRALLSSFLVKFGQTSNPKMSRIYDAVNAKLDRINAALGKVGNIINKYPEFKPNYVKFGEALSNWETATNKVDSLKSAPDSYTDRVKAQITLAQSWQSGAKTGVLSSWEDLAKNLSSWAAVTAESAKPYSKPTSEKDNV